MMRWDVVDVLRRVSSARRFAQILTWTTSTEMLSRPEIAVFPVATTLMYTSPEQRAIISRPGDGRPLLGLDELIEMERSRPTFADLVFVDPWHTYADSLGSLRLASRILSPHGGWLVVHDCNPPARELVGRLGQSWELAWCGDTWRAFVDFTANLAPDADWCVLDTDYGVGVVRIPPTPSPAQRPGRWRGAVAPNLPAPFRRLVPVGFDDDQAWRWLEDDRTARLRLVRPDAWLAALTETDTDRVIGRP